jgi:hypothetical protein
LHATFLLQPLQNVARKSERQTISMFQKASTPKNVSRRFHFGAFPAWKKEGKWGATVQRGTVLVGARGDGLMGENGARACVRRAIAGSA